MNIQEIQIDLIDIPEFYFSIDDAVAIKKLESSIRSFGLIRPIVVGRVGARYECLEGRQILKIVKSMQQTSVMCVIYENESGFSTDLVNAVLNLMHPAESLARIAHFIKERVELTEESAVSSILPYSTDEIKRFVEICSFDWAQFEKKQNEGQCGMFDVEEPTEQEIIAATEEIVIMGSSSMQEEKIEPTLGTKGSIGQCAGGPTGISHEGGPTGYTKEEMQPVQIQQVTPTLEACQKEENNTHESEDKHLVKEEPNILRVDEKQKPITSEEITRQLREEILAEKASKKKSEKKAEQKTNKQNEGEVTNLFS